jgi:hypothetical protein
MSAIFELLGKPLEFGIRLVRWARCRFQADHTAIVGASSFPYMAHGSLPRVHVLVQVAPSRRLRRTVPPHEHLVRRGAALAQAVAGDRLPPEPRHLDGTCVSFQQIVTDDWEHVDRAVHLRVNGQVEVFWPVGDRPPPDGPYDLPITELLEPLYRLAKVVEDGTYWRLLTGRPRRRFIRQRVDWRVTIAWTAQAGASNLRNWTGLAFPAAQPSGRAAANGVSFSASPIAASAMWNLPQSTNPRHLLGAVIDELLRWCGYYGGEQRVINETLDEVTQYREATLSSRAGAARPSA